MSEIDPIGEERIAPNGLGNVTWTCPNHSLSLAVGENGFVCPAGEIFPVRNRIPRFVPANTYADSFGSQWNKFRCTQLDSCSGTSVTAKRTRRCLGEELWASLPGKEILECGCGAGRFTEILLGQGASVTSFDLSDAVDANQENFPQNGNHRILQADILELPFSPRQFDIAFCLGVLQYTADPEQAISALCKQVKPGGAIVIDCYTPNISWSTKTAPLFRFYLRSLPAPERFRWTEGLVNTLLPLHRAMRNFRPGQMLLSRVSPVSCYYAAIPELTDEQQREWALLDTHNSLTGWYRHSRTRGQIVAILERLGLEKIWCEYGGNGVEARAFLPT